MCSECLMTAHAHNPFHRIEQWNQSFFSSTNSLQALGLIIHLSHGSETCPYSGVSQRHNITLVDLNGIQTITVEYCFCPGQTDKFAQVRQLIAYGLFPATTKSPSTVFTQKLLRDFHIDTTCSRISAYDFMEKIRRLSNRMFVHQVPVCDSQFL
jgi:hypothetical protein